MDPLEKAAAWRIAAATVVGTSHRRLGTDGQDAHAVHVSPERGLILAVADGAGSSRLGGRGAALAVETVVQALEAETTLTGEALLRGAFARAAFALEAEALAQDVPRRELSTTLLAVQVTDEAIVFGHVGDGAVVAGEDPEALVTLSAPQNDGEYANETTFLTSPDALASARVTRVAGRFAHVALLSDGLQRLALSGAAQAPHLPFFRPLFRFTAAQPESAAASGELAVFLSSPRVAERTDDDLTLILATRAG